MSFSRKNLFTFKILEAGLLTKTIEAIIGDKPKSTSIDVLERLADGSRVSHTFTSASELSRTCDLRTNYVQAYTKTSSGDSRFVSLTESDGLIEAHVSTDTAENTRAVLDLLIKGLDLTEASDEFLARHRVPTIKELSDRLSILERIVLGPNRRLRCFLSYRFTPENEEPARKLREFLRLLAIDVVTGNTYEPRAISHKIMDKLNDDIDFVILLIGSDGESFWTRDEIATANNKTIPLIPIVEEGANFSAGLFGDLEYITYGKNHIGDSLLKVLEAIKYVREKSTPSNSGESHS